MWDNETTSINRVLSPIIRRTYVGDIERAERNVSIDNIKKLAKAFKISIQEMFKE